jgi:hypothetical protein
VGVGRRQGGEYPHRRIGGNRGRLEGEREGGGRGRREGEEEGRRERAGKCWSSVGRVGRREGGGYPRRRIGGN